MADARVPLTEAELEALAEAIAVRLADRLPLRGRRRVEFDLVKHADARALERMGLIKKPERAR